MNASGETSVAVISDGQKKRKTTKGDPPVFGPVRGSIRYFAGGVSRSGKKIGGSLEDTHLGLKIYRDRCRVRPYGEPKDDWLGLNTKRLDTGKPWSLRTDAAAGSVHITTAQNPRLVDSSDRESGMDRNPEFEAFVEFVRMQTAILDDILAQHKRSQTRSHEAQARQRVLNDLARCLTRLDTREFGNEALAIDRRKKANPERNKKAGARGERRKTPGQDRVALPELRTHMPELRTHWRVLKSGPAPSRCMELAVDRNGTPREISGCGSED